MLLDLESAGRKSYLVGMIVGFFLLASGTINMPTALADDLPGMRRATLLVGNIKNSISFYEQIGFEVWYDGIFEAEPEKNFETPLPLQEVAKGSRMVIMRGIDP